MKSELGNLLFNRELFIKVIEQLEKQKNYDDKCTDAFEVILPSNFITGYDNHLLVDMLIELLNIAFNENKDESIIDYFIWEVDFGKKYKEGCITDKIFGPIDISCAGKLWDYLSNKKA